MDQYQSWGRYPQVHRQRAVRLPAYPTRLPVLDAATKMLPYGRGASQGDSCLNEDGILLDTRNLDHFIRFDDATGLLTCEAGVTLAEIVQEFLPRGWFLPVTPGTKYVTVGGAIANDVHGKNHFRAGTFGAHVTQFELLRSDGERYACSADNHPELFAATIGGLGLTGLITWAEIQLKRVPGPHLATEIVPFRDVDHWLELTNSYLSRYEYLIGQVNGMTRSRRFGSGIVLAGNHTDARPVTSPSRTKTRAVPFNAPNWLLNDVTMGMYHWWYRTRMMTQKGHGLMHYDPFFYPLDSIGYWNRLYGSRGFLQYQAVYPLPQAADTIRQMFVLMKQHRLSSYLISLKRFGDRSSPGMLSFPQAGVAIALDFPMRGSRTLVLLDAFDDVARARGGRVYPAKDARLAAADFQRSYPRWQEFAKHTDPAFSSSFWRRVTDVKESSKK